LGKRSHDMQVEGLARFLDYVLGRQPDEFGLVPDADGYVSFKELLKAIQEDPEWRQVRQGGIREVLMGEKRGWFEADERKIRAVERSWVLPGSGMPLSEVPRMLFAAVRQRAHPVVMEKGLMPQADPFVVLSEDREMAARLGRRRDPEPVVLEIRASASRAKGVRYFGFGRLFLSPGIPAEFIAGPKVDQALLEARALRREAKEKTAAPQPDFTPGSFLLEPLRDPQAQRKRSGRKRKGWKEESRKVRRGR